MEDADSCLAVFSNKILYCPVLQAAGCRTSGPVMLFHVGKPADDVSGQGHRAAGDIWKEGLTGHCYQTICRVPGVLLPLRPCGLDHKVAPETVPSVLGPLAASRLGLLVLETSRGKLTC